MSTDESSAVMPLADHNLLATIKQSFNLLAQVSAVKGSVSNSVRTRIESMLHSGPPRIEDVANNLKTPKWTHQRCLRDEGVSFFELVESVRKGAARGLLASAEISISELAERLGYAEIPSFTHAFVRWFGVSPRQWREKH